LKTGPNHSAFAHLVRGTSLNARAAALSETTTRAIFRSVETGNVHFRGTEGGLLLICLN
jgi:hypothetical protein